MGFSKDDFYIVEDFIISSKINKQRIEKIKEMSLSESAEIDERKIDNPNIPILLFASSINKITTARDSFEFCKTKKGAKTIQNDSEHLRRAVSLGFDN